MATIAELMIHLGVDTKNVRRDAEKAAPEAEAAGRKSGEKFASGFGTAARAIKGVIASAMAAVSIAAVAHGVMNLTATASDLNETASKSSVIFGDATSKVMDFAAGAETAMGQSQKAALDGASTFAIYGKGAGLAGTKLVDFSTNLVKTASDMASFSNTSPQEAIEAIGSALRGEMDPIEKYGVLLSEATVKAQALKLGLIKTTTAALTPQQKVLAVNAALMEQLGEKGSNTLGDFARTSSGLANQQRILTASMTNMRAEVGQALLPVMTSLVSSLNTQLMPALRELWETHGQKVIAWLQQVSANVGPSIGKLVDKITSIDWAAVLERGQQAFAKLWPELAKMGQEGGVLNDTLSLTKVTLGFLADHIDLVGKALPVLIIAMLAFRSAQAAANTMQMAAVPLKAVELVTTHRQTKAMRAHTAALLQNTVAQRGSTAAAIADNVATNKGIVAKGRAVVANMAMRVSELAKAAATGIATAAQFLLDIAMAPVTLIILAIVAGVALLVLGILWLWRNNEGFRNFIIAAWAMIKKAFEATISWITDTAIPFVVKWFNVWLDGVKLVYQFVVTWFGKIVSFVGSLPGRIGEAAKGMWDGMVAAAKGALNKVISIWNGVDIGLTIGPIPDWVPGVGGKSFSIPDLFPDIPMLAAGGFTPATPGGHVAVLGEGAQDEITAPEPKFKQWVREAMDDFGTRGGDGDYMATVDWRNGTEMLSQFVDIRVERKLDRTARRVRGGVRG